MYYFIGTVMVIIMILGFLENFAIIYTFVKQKKIRTVDNLFIVGIAISDIGQAILGVPLVVLSSFRKHWIFGYSACQYYAFVTTFLGISQVAMLTTLAVERYFIIVRCDRKLSQSFCKCTLTITAAFLFGFGWALGPLLGWSSYEEEIKGIACSVSWEIKDTNHLSYTISLFTFGWFIPLAVITCSYLNIARTILKEKASHQNVQIYSMRRYSRDKKVAVTLFLMIGAFITSWLPYSVVSMWSAFGNYNSIPPAVQIAPAVFAKCSIIWNPIIYVARHSCFRKAVKVNIVCFKWISLLRNKNKKGDQMLMDILKKTRNENESKDNILLESNFLNDNNSCDDLDETNIYTSISIKPNMPYNCRLFQTETNPNVNSCKEVQGSQAIDTQLDNVNPGVNAAFCEENHEPNGTEKNENKRNLPYKLENKIPSVYSSSVKTIQNHDKKDRQIKDRIHKQLFASNKGCDFSSFVPSNNYERSGKGALHNNSVERCVKNDTYDISQRTSKIYMCISKNNTHIYKPYDRKIDTLNKQRVRLRKQLSCLYSEMYRTRRSPRSYFTEHKDEAYKRTNIPSLPSDPYEMSKLSYDTV